MSDLADTRDAWAGRITKAWRQSFEQILETGRLLIAAKAALAHGEFLEMVERDLPFGERTAERLMEIGRDPRLANPTTWSHLPSGWRTLYELTRLGDDDFEAALADTSVRPDMTVREAEALVAGRRSSAPPAVRLGADMPEAEPVETALPTTEVTPPHSAPNGARAIMASRQEPHDSLNFFPTPPWATRALFEHALAHLGVTEVARVWEPACGEGHIALVLLDYAFTSVVATDIFDYSRDGRSPPAWFGQRDFLDEAQETLDVDWVITNPPFGDTTERFVLRALAVAKVGVAMFVRMQWLETVGRYEAIFKDNPPTLIAFFAERVPICKGRWDPDGSTATAYIWLVWIKGRAPVAPFWIPPGCREQLTRSDDLLILPSTPSMMVVPTRPTKPRRLSRRPRWRLPPTMSCPRDSSDPWRQRRHTFSDGAQSTSGEGEDRAGRPCLLHTTGFGC